MKKKLRLLVTENCNRNCEGCCNKDWDLSSLEVCTSYKGYDEVHNNKDVYPFLAFNEYLSRHVVFHNKSLRLNIFKGIPLLLYSNVNWKIKDNIEWMKDCPLPKDEVFMRLENKIPLVKFICILQQLLNIQLIS